MSKTTFIEAKGLTKVYRKGDQTITPLENLSLKVNETDFIALMGPSGSGKSTLLNLIAGVDSLTSGTLRVGQTNIEKLTRDQLTKWRAKNVGYIFQLYHLLPVLSAFENVELPLLLTSMSRKTRKERVEEVLGQVGLLDRQNHRPKELSGGQEQRVAIARAIVANPPLIVADEPTGDLDRESANEILNLLESLCKEHKKTILMVTHDPKAAERANCILELEKGRLLTSR
jgi:putative ABC transport system ATP-binding protein